MHFNEINICAECATPLLWKSDLPARGALDDFSRHNGKKKSTKVSISSIHTIRKSHSTKNFSYPPPSSPLSPPNPTVPRCGDRDERARACGIRDDGSSH